MGILGKQRREALAELGMNLFGSPATEPLELVALLVCDPGNLGVGRRSREHDQPVDEVGAARGQCQGDAPTR